MRKITEIMEEMKAGAFKELLKDIYVDEGVIEYQEGRYVRALTEYVSIFGEREVEIYSAPGRSEVGGNHTDHQHGMVLATSINLDAIAIVNKNEDATVNVYSDGYGMIELTADDLTKRPEEESTSAGLIRGVLGGLAERGYKVGGFNAYVTSDVLNGAGMSSSAAFETIIGTIISGLYNDMVISMVEVAQVGQFAENVYFGKPCGLMDQTACAVGGLIHIDFADPAKPIVEKVNVDFEEYKYSLCIVDTKGSHHDLTDDYAKIPEEMKLVAEFFGKEFLREVSKADFYANIAALREKAGDRPVLRALHFFEDNDRVAAQVNALNSGNFEGFLKMIKDSGDSSFKYLQNIYTNKDVQNQSMSIALAVSEMTLGEHGVCRVHGGGFAGTIQAFVQNDFVETYRKALDAVFGEGACHVLKVRKYGGMKVM
ncbi:MAG: galactokinase family protein [Bariatricus sp.]|nr:galactokinase family protein [Bariatricus sp.]